ncbi:hypothetical protein [Burkholderia ambifaria]|uniref:hypothetical protein n=1 Tax=Burkholderia ambifaria TaxID=152480 RepID=UPI00158BCFF9|nr:hypothetical protein [Burkholderia ambifaria]
MQSASVGKTGTDTSALYGVGGDVNAMTADAVRAYGGDPGQQFANRANWNLQLEAGLREQAFVGGLQDQFDRLANDTFARSAAFKQQMGDEFAVTASQKLAAQRSEHAAIAARMQVQERAEQAYASQSSNGTNETDFLSSIGVKAGKSLTMRTLEASIQMPRLVDNQPGFKAWDGSAGTGPYDRTAGQLAVALDPISGATGGAAYTVSSIANYISPTGVDPPDVAQYTGMMAGMAASIVPVGTGAVKGLSAQSALIEAETSALQRIAANNRLGSTERMARIRALTNWRCQT